MRLRIPLCRTAFVFAMASFLVPALASGTNSSSRASVSRVIQADIVSGSTSYCQSRGFGPNGGGCARMQPNTLDANDGDVVRICNRSKVIVPLFTLSVHNSLAGGKASALQRGACLEVTVHNPINKTYEVRLFSEIQNQVGLKINVASPHPSAPVEPQPAAPLESIAGDYTSYFRGGVYPGCQISLSGNDVEVTNQYGDTATGTYDAASKRLLLTAGWPDISAGTPFVGTISSSGRTIRITWPNLKDGGSGGYWLQN